MVERNDKLFLGVWLEGTDQAHLAKLVDTTGIDRSNVTRIALRLLTREALAEAIKAGVLANGAAQVQVVS